MQAEGYETARAMNAAFHAPEQLEQLFPGQGPERATRDEGFVTEQWW